MAIAESWNGYVAIKQQSGRTQASGSGALILPVAGGQGGRMTKAPIADPRIRRDNLQPRGRHGSQRTNGAYDSTLSMGGMDPILAAIMRTSFGSADLAITESAMTSITTTANTIVAAAGNWITEGLRVHDVIRLTGHASAGNNARNLRITGLTSSTITVAETLTLNATPDTAFTVTRPGRVLKAAGAGSVLKPYFTIEEYEYDTDQSELFTDCVWSRLRIAMNPDGVLTSEVAWTGTGQFEVKDSASSPFFTSPTEPTALSLAAVDATLRAGTVDIAELTSFDFTIDYQASAPPVTGPSKYAPDVFLGTQQLSLNLEVMRKDLLDVADFIAENQISLHLMAQENETAPPDFFSLALPNFTYGGIDKSALAKPGVPRTVKRTIPMELFGIDSRAGAYDPTMVKMQVSNSA